MTPPDLVLVVDRIGTAGPDIRSLSLRRPGGGELPSFRPGSHLVLDCGGVSNAYSLTGDGIHPEAYTLSVRLDPQGQGGSGWVHRLRAGDHVACRGPRDAFAPVATARHHLLVAGGIGITPMLSHLRAAQVWGRSAALIYAVSGPEPAAHAADLAETGAPVMLVRGRDAMAAALDSALSSQPLGTHLYVCGPGGLIDRVLAMAAEKGWPPERCHAERFGVPALPPGQPFAVHLRRAGRTIEVPGDSSLLDALAAAGVAWPAMCRRGVCGECRMDDAGGRILHQDFVLSAAEREAGSCLMPCVSRAEGVLTLEL